MGLSQMSALTGGKRFKRPYVAEINARKRYLPQQSAQKKEDAYRNQMFGLQQRGLAQDREFGLADLALREDALDEQKKAQKKANRLGYANIGLGGALGVAGLAQDGDWFGSTPSKEVAPVAVDFMSSLPHSTAAESIVPALGPVKEAASQGLDFLSGGLANPADMDFTQWADIGGDLMKKLGSGAPDALGGFYDSVVGDYLDMGDWADFGDFG